MENENGEGGVVFCEKDVGFCMLFRELGKGILLSRLPFHLMFRKKESKKAKKYTNPPTTPGLPTKVSASAAQGTAIELGCVPETEDTITLLVTWSKTNSPPSSSSSPTTKTATSIHTSSWTAPQKAGVHSNQYFHYLAATGEIRINQAKRGYDVATDEDFMWYNPFYMRYSPDERGDFGGQAGYGYVSFEKFVDGCTVCDLSFFFFYFACLPFSFDTMAYLFFAYKKRKKVQNGKERGRQPDYEQCQDRQKANK